jgi:hypothetical protein
MFLKRFKLTKPSRRRSLLFGVSILLLIGLIGISAWNDRQNQKNIKQQTAENKATFKVLSDKKQQKKEQAIKRNLAPLALAEEKLPQDWTAEMKDPQRIRLNNEQLKCYVDVFRTADTSGTNSPQTDQYKQTADAFKRKNYSVDYSQGKLSINTSGGKQQLESQDLVVSGRNNLTFQKYAYITKEDSYTRIQLTCPVGADLPSAEAALLSVGIPNQ